MPFIDYLTYLNGSLPISVSAIALPNAHNFNDTLNVLLKFQNGSTGVIGYYSNGSKSMSKEYIEVFAGGQSAILDDFKSLRVYGKSKPKSKKLLNSK